MSDGLTADDTDGLRDLADRSGRSAKTLEALAEDMLGSFYKADPEEPS